MSSLIYCRNTAGNSCSQATPLFESFSLVPRSPAGTLSTQPLELLTQEVSFIEFWAQTRACLSSGVALDYTAVDRTEMKYSRSKTLAPTRSINEKERVLFTSIVVAPKGGNQLLVARP